MARSAITVLSLADFNSEGTVTKDAIDATNDHSIDVSAVKDQTLTVYIETTNTVAATFAIKAGDYSAASQGDLSITTGSAILQGVKLETARFKDNDGLILIDVTSTGVTGNLFAVSGD